MPAKSSGERAVTLARWMGTGKRPVTAAQVLGKADAPAAGAAIGVQVPPNTRTAADAPELHGPWSVAIATGLLRISDGMATSGHALDSWPPSDAVLLDAWFAGLRAACEALADPRQEDGFTGMLVFALALLTVLQQDAGLLRHPGLARVHGGAARRPARPLRGVRLGPGAGTGREGHSVARHRIGRCRAGRQGPRRGAVRGLGVRARRRPGRSSGVVYPSEENPQEPEKFNLTEVNRKLAKLGR